jgi:uncharacterized protein with PIN domain
MRTLVYFDTSALAKWYLNEARSEDVEKFIQERGPVSISDLTIVEMRCLLARRRREGDIDRNTELLVFATLQDEVRQGFLLCHPMPEGTAAAVREQIRRARLKKLAGWLGRVRVNDAALKAGELAERRRDRLLGGSGAAHGR